MQLADKWCHTERDCCIIWFHYCTIVWLRLEGLLCPSSKFLCLRNIIESSGLLLYSHRCERHNCIIKLTILSRSSPVCTNQNANFTRCVFVFARVCACMRIRNFQECTLAVTSELVRVVSVSPYTCVTTVKRFCIVSNFCEVLICVKQFFRVGSSHH